MSDKSYEKPEVLPGDLIECLETGGKGIISETSRSHESHPVKWSITPLPGSRIKTAWWDRSEFKVIEKGPAHKYWTESLLAQKTQDDRRKLEQDIDWVIANWEFKDSMSSNAAIMLLREAGLMPDQTGLMSRGEIGVATLQLFDIFRAHIDEFEKAMTSEDPKAAILEIGIRAKNNQIEN